MSKSRQMRMGWGLLLVATLVAAWFAPAQQDDSVVLSTRVAPTPTHQQSTLTAMTSPTDPGLGVVVRKSSEQSISNVQVLRVRDRSHTENEEMSVFSKVAWERLNVAVHALPAEMVPPQALPVRPTAPALPFRVMGRYEERGKSIVFLLQADQSWAVHEGDTFAESYKVERIASNAIHLRYLPLNEVQVLEIGVAP